MIAQASTPMGPAIDDPRSLVIVEDMASGGAALRSVCGEDVAVTTAETLSRSWPDYVVARARTSGAIIVRGAERSEAFRPLATGELFGRPGAAGLVAGALVFVLDADEPTLAAAA